MLLELGIDERGKLGINFVDGKVFIYAGIIREHWVVGGMMLGVAFDARELNKVGVTDPS